MRAHVVSDLHLKVGANHQPLEVVGDVLILAGDILNGTATMQPLLDVTRAYRQAGLPILYVPGNHEFLGGSIARTLRKLDLFCRENQISLLHNKSVCIGGVRFYGTTLWTSFKLPGMTNLKKNMETAEWFMPDHRIVWIDRKKKQLFSATRARALHTKSRRLLEAYLARKSDLPVVVITHHAPSLKGVAPIFRVKETTVCFAVNLEPVFAELNPAVWVFGHTHYSVDELVLKTRIVSNPRGHDNNVRSFNPRFVVEM